MSRLRAGAARRAAVLGLLLAACVAALTVAHASGSPRSSSRAQLVAYEQRLLPVVKDWGSIEVLGMRPAIADLRAGDALGRPSVVAAQARAWRAALRADRAALSAAQPPREMLVVAALLDQAMARYLEATDLFLTATTSSGDDRGRLVERGIAAASSGARTYDEAGRRLRTVLLAHGAQPDPAWGHGS